jgi:hypothetical protein
MYNLGFSKRVAGEEEAAPAPTNTGLAGGIACGVVTEHALGECGVMTDTF